MCREKTPWEKAVEFHGHACPGLVIGFRAAEEALRRLGVTRSGDEELVAIVETEACGADALQVLTGCTFGKGNLIFRDWGKHVFTVARRRDGRGIRVALKPEVMAAMRERRQRAAKDAPADPAAAQAAMAEEVQRLREMPAEELFSVREVQLDLPEQAKVFPTVTCAVCGEGVMEPRARVREGKIVCPACAEEYRVPLFRL